MTEHVNPPIPARFWDWRAYLEGREENRKLYGWGQNEALAVADLLEALYENFPLTRLPQIQQAHEQFWAQKRGEAKCVTR